MSYLIELPDLPIRITDRGDWLHGNEPLHPRAVKLFEKHIVASEEGYGLRIGFSTAPLEVADTAYFVRSMALYRTADGEGLKKIDIVVSDDSQEELEPSTLMQSETNVLYCRVLRSGLWVPCRFPPHHYHALALHAEMDERGAYLPVNGRHWYLQPYDRRPKDQILR